MNTKTLLAALASGVAAFLLGWVIYGIMLKGYMDAHTSQAALGLMKTEPGLGYLLAGDLVYGLAIAWALGRMGATSAMTGFVAGLILMGLIGLGYDLMFFGLMNMYNGHMAMVVDVLASAVIGGIAGAVAGAVLGTGNKPAA